jgi:hypothetical protein
MDSIVLHRTVNVRCWRVIGQVAKATKRTELMPVLLRARERGATDATDLAAHLLFEPRSRRVVAQRLLTIASRYGLLEERDRVFGLTESGEIAVATEHVFVPEHGTWTIWASEDLLLPGVVLHVEAWKEPTAYDEVRGEGREAAEDRSFEKLPRWLMAVRGSPSTPAASGGAQIRIDHLESAGEVTDPEASLRVVWDVMAGRSRLEGQLGGAHVKTALEPPRTPTAEVWRQLLESEGLWSRWDATHGTLRVGFDETSAGEREVMSRDVAFRRPSLAGLGAFEPMTVHRVPLGARSASDAERWARWRLCERLRDYATAERFATWSAEAIAPFQEFQPILPPRRALVDVAWAQRAKTPPSTVWHLVAAEDWGL